MNNNWTFISKNKRLRIVLKAGTPAEPLTGRVAVPGEYVSFEDGIFKTNDEELAKKIMAHEGFNQDFIQADDTGKDPYARMRPPEVQHDIIEINHGSIGKNLNPKPKFVLTPELKDYLDKVTTEIATAKFKEMVDMLKTKVKENKKKKENETNKTNKKNKEIKEENKNKENK